MKNDLTDSYTSFDGLRLIAAGSLLLNALAVKRVLAGNTDNRVLTFSDHTGKVTDIETKGSEAKLKARYGTPEKADTTSPEPAEIPAPLSPHAEESRGRGRPKLGVVAREVTLLPRHWEWLATQSGGASVALRKLVEEARRTHANKDRVRQAQERAYHFMLAIAGDLPGYEEATRALFAHDQARFTAVVASWPADVRDHATRLAFHSGESASPQTGSAAVPRS